VNEHNTRQSSRKSSTYSTVSGDGHIAAAQQRYQVGNVLSIKGFWAKVDKNVSTNVFVIAASSYSLKFIYPGQAGRVSEKACVAWLRQLFDDDLVTMDGMENKERQRWRQHLLSEGQSQVIHGEATFARVIERVVPDNELSTALVEGDENDGDSDICDDDTGDDDDVEMTHEGPQPGPRKVILRGNDGNKTDRITQEECDGLFQEAFGGKLYRSESTEMTNDAQRWWKRCSMLSGQQWYPPGRGQLATDIITILTETILALAKREQPSEWIIICQATLLQRSKGVTQSADIKRLLQRRVEMWRNNEFEALVQEAERCNKELQAASRAKRGKPRDKDQTASIFMKMIFQCKYRDAVRFISDEVTGGVLEMSDEVEVNGRKGTAHEVLAAKHPAATLPLRAALLQRPTDAAGREAELPRCRDIDVTAGDIESIARRLRGGGGPGGTDSSIWNRLLLHHGPASAALREAVAELARMVSNEVADQDGCEELLRAFNANRLVALDKCPGVRPIGIGECLRRIIGKVVALKTKHEVVDEGGTDQLATSLPAAIEGGVHTMRELWEQYGEEDHEDGYGMLLVDASNAFNAVNRIAALWNARQKWPSAARFLFNTYRGYSLLVIRSSAASGAGTIMLSREGVTQGDPMSMFLYAIAILPLIRRCTMNDPDCRQVWYADDSSAAGRLTRIRQWLDVLIAEGPSFGYFPEAAKSYLIVAPRYVELAKRKFAGLPVKIVHGQRFLGGFVGSAELRAKYVQEKTTRWVTIIKRLAEMGDLQPQAAFVAFQKSLSAEWTYLKRVLPDTAEHFTGVEQAIAKELLPKIFGRINITSLERDVYALPARDGGVGVPDPSSEVTDDAFSTSRAASSHLIDSLQKGTAFDLESHNRVRKEAASKHRADKQRRNKATAEALIGQLGPKQQRAVNRIRDHKLSCLLTYTPVAAMYTTLDPHTFRDHLAIRYGNMPVHVQHQCDGCSARPIFDLDHALSCKKGGMVNWRHNEVRDVFGDFAHQAWNNAEKEPIIEETREGRVALRADLLVHGVWTRQQAALFDIRVTHTDSASYLTKTPKQVMRTQAMEKVNLYGPATSRRGNAHFTPLVMGTAGEMDEDTIRFINVMASTLAGKWNKRYGEAKGWINLRLQIALARACSMCIRRTRLPWRGLGAVDGAAIPQQH
jgi:hypothetical protein